MSIEHWDIINNCNNNYYVNAQVKGVAIRGEKNKKTR